MFFVSHGDGHLGHVGSTAKKQGETHAWPCQFLFLLFNLQKNFFLSEKGSFFLTALGATSCMGL